MQAGVSDVLMQMRDLARSMGMPEELAKPPRPQKMRLPVIG
jgi:hypothetical protein